MQNNKHKKPKFLPGDHVIIKTCAMADIPANCPGIIDGYPFRGGYPVMVEAMFSNIAGNVRTSEKRQETVWVASKNIKLKM